MSTVHQPPREPEEPERPAGFDPTRDVLRPARPPGARPPYQPLSGRAAAATAVFGLLLVLDVVAVGSSMLEVDLLDQLAAGENVSDAKLDANDTRQAMIGLGQSALGLACAITFISWLHRAYSNMEAISPPYRRFDTGWSIGAWFVPFLNLWRPKQIVNDVWNSGTPVKNPPPWLMLWWIGWLVSNVLGRIAFPGLDPDASLAELRSDSVNYMIADGFDVAVLALAIVVIRVLTKRQEAKADAQAGQAPEPAAAIASPQPA
jgi:hypothetical protein